VFLLYSLSLGPYLFFMSFFQFYLPESVRHMSELIFFPHLLIAYHIKAYWYYGQWWLSWFGLRNWPGNHEGFQKYMQSEHLGGHPTKGSEVQRDENVH